MGTVFAFCFLLCTDIILPAALVWGWIRWVRSESQRNLLSYFSTVGFSLATVSAILAVASVVYAHLIGGFPFYDPRLLRIYRWGTLLSLAGILSAIGGLWGRSPLRWLAPACAAGTLLFWFGAAIGE